VRASVGQSSVSESVCGRSTCKRVNDREEDTHTSHSSRFDWKERKLKRRYFDIWLLHPTLIRLIEVVYINIYLFVYLINKNNKRLP
jgi:hypothetical protein